MAVGPLWFESPVEFPACGERIKPRPEASRQPGQRSRAESSGFCHGRAKYGNAGNICLHLHEQAVLGGAAVYSELGDGLTRIAPHGGDQVG